MPAREAFLRASFVLAACALCACPGPQPPNDASDAPTTDASPTDAADAGSGDDAATTPDTSLPDPPPPMVELGRHTVTLGETRRIVPSDGLPPETPAQVSNNNLDVIRHDDGMGPRVYLVWRTAPNHFASPNTAIYVVSSSDEVHWRFEARFTAGTDLRETRFLSLGTTLHLYISRLGNDPLMFTPMGFSHTARSPDGTWGPLTEIYHPGYMEWRTRVERGTPYMLTYLHGENIYLFNGMPLDVELLTTTDGITWTGVNPTNPVIYHGGGSEADFAIGDDGTLYGVIRNEAGDDRGWGSEVCHAPAGNLASWTCRHDPRKYDSPYMFWYDGEAYLIGRRNLTPTGNYDLMRRDRSFYDQAVLYETDYSSRRKRCSIWRFVQGEDRMAYIADLPSRGDTCFAGVVRGAREGEFDVYNYSSDVDGPDLAWNLGQNNPTYIYRTVVQFTRR